jgi:hypothetical protein
LEERAAEGALRRRSSASSRSGWDKNAALAQCTMHERARDGLAPGDLLLGDDDDVDRNGKRREGIAQADHLPQLAVHMLLDREEVKVAVLVRISTRHDPKSSTRAGERAAAANRRPASMITASLTIRHYGTG